LKDNKIVKDSILDLIEKIIRNCGFKEELMQKPLQKNELKSIYTQVKKEIKVVKIMNEENKEKIIIGMMMNHLRSRVNGKNIAEFIKEQQKGANS